MPRNYKRKTETKYSLEDLKKALNDVKTNYLDLDLQEYIASAPWSEIQFSHIYLRIPHEQK